MPSDAMFAASFARPGGWTHTRWTHAPNWRRHQSSSPAQLSSRQLPCFSTGSSQAAPAAAEPEAAQPCTPPSSEGQPSRLDSIPTSKLKELRKEGLAMKDRIKMGRRGVAEGFITQVFHRWNTSEVAKLYCHGKPAANMRLISQQLEERTGGIVVHRAGGTVFLYRGEPWPRDPPPLPPQGEGEGEGGDEEQQQQQQQGPSG